MAALVLAGMTSSGSLVAHGLLDRSVFAVRRLTALDHSPLVSLGGLRPGRDVEIKRVGAWRGSGAFARRRLRRGELVGWYTGDLLPTEEFVQRRAAGDTSGDYAIALCESHITDAEDASRSSWLRYINHSWRRANTASFYVPPRSGLSPEHGATMFCTSREVKPGEELLVDYGRDYWLARFPLGPLDPRWWRVECS